MLGKELAPSRVWKLTKGEEWLNNVISLIVQAPIASGISWYELWSDPNNVMLT